MSEEPQFPPKKLRWWFWLVLFCPTIFFLLIGLIVPYFVTGYDQLRWLIATGVFVGMPVNLICSFISAFHLNRVKRAGTAWRTICGTALLLSVMNMILAYAGCAAAAEVGNAMN